MCRKEAFNHPCPNSLCCSVVFWLIAAQKEQWPFLAFGRPGLQRIEKFQREKSGKVGIRGVEDVA
jgi:hypothetical protein